MKPKSFRHLTAHSRKRVLRRIARRWQDCANDVAHWESEKDFAEAQNDLCAASWASMRLAFATRHLAQLEHELQ